MFEKVNPMHPDKIADRIAGAIVDHAYTLTDKPIVKVDVMIGYGVCNIMAETSINVTFDAVREIVNRIAGAMKINYVQVPVNFKVEPVDTYINGTGYVAANPVTVEEADVANVAYALYNAYHTEGKCVISGNDVHINHSDVLVDDLSDKLMNSGFHDAFQWLFLNTYGSWKGGPNVHSGMSNHRLGSDFGSSNVGRAFHGRDASAPEVALTVYAWLQAQEKQEKVEIAYDIGDFKIWDVPYEDIVKIAKCFIDEMGGFEKVAEWGLL